jgi:hypothetical protein
VGVELQVERVVVRMAGARADAQHDGTAETKIVGRGVKVISLYPRSHR